MSRIPDTGTTPQTYIDLGDGLGLVDSNLSPRNDPDRKFRGAWDRSGKVVVVNMDKARDIHRDALRAERKELLEALDVKYQRADEEGQDKTDIIAQKKALREVTKDARIDAATTPEELSALTLGYLIS